MRDHPILGGVAHSYPHRLQRRCMCGSAILRRTSGKAHSSFAWNSAQWIPASPHFGHASASLNSSGQAVTRIGELPHSFPHRSQV